ncbi:MAG: hypothetical protein NT007_18280 [Candidatus Kapabacteria bacterium]|nr:hypothetical protein [Candidatus Kapabacteria bacterium]
MILKNTNLKTHSVIIVILICFYYDSNCQIITNLSQDKIQTTDSSKSKIIGPGPDLLKSYYTRMQDTNFKKALTLRIPISARLDYDLIATRNDWESYFSNIKPSPFENARRNLLENFYRYMQPSEQEIVQHQIGIEKSLEVPGIKTLMKGGLSVPFSTIASLLGMTEDVSPEINYTIENFTDIEVVVYSIQAVVVSTLFKGTQPPGSYNLRWNGRDDDGRRMPNGDYIMEVRIGSEKYIRKRTLI